MVGPDAWSAESVEQCNRKMAQTSDVTAAAVPLRWRFERYGPGRSILYGGEHVAEAFAQEGFGHSPALDDDWDVLWTHHQEVTHLLKQRPQWAAPASVRRKRLVNHCNYFKAIGQKCHLERHLVNVRAAIAARAEALEDSREPVKYLTTYQLSNNQERAAWLAAVSADQSRTWVLKPCSAGRSEGIELVRGSKAAGETAKRHHWAVAQEYLSRPLLLRRQGLHKFHLRLYVHVASWAPHPTGFLFDEGLAFRSREVYGNTPNVNRDVFSGVSDKVEPLSLASIWQEIGDARAKLVWRRIVRLFEELLLSEAVAQSFGDAGVLEQQRGFDCFDLIGADVMISEDLEPYLLEINQGPNLWVERDGPGYEPLMRGIKTTLVEQLAAWMREKLSHGDDLEKEEQYHRFVNFTRVTPATQQP